VRFSYPIIVVAGLLACPHSLAQANDLPPGWRLPLAREMADEPLRKNSPTRYAKVVGDFNGDGVDDEAFLLKSTRFSGEALWVHLSGPGGTFSWVMLSEIRWGKEYQNVKLGMGIDLIKPGVVPYACFDSAPYDDCQWGDRKAMPKLRLQDPGIMYFRFESAASMYFWSNSKQRFLRVWFSD
jgi:hypothetical protein